MTVSVVIQATPNADSEPFLVTIILATVRIPCLLPMLLLLRFLIDFIFGVFHFMLLS